MYKYLLQSAEGIQYFGIIALVTFFAVFVFWTVRTYMRPKAEMDAMAALPLFDEPTKQP
jgi:cbb3-type cytochrome oxidase subunit 3